MFLFHEEALDPRWENAGRVHDWRNYISEDLRFIWRSFTDGQKLAIAENADTIAAREAWD